MISRDVTLIVAAWSALPTGLFWPVNCAPADKVPAPVASETTHAANVDRSSIENDNRILQNLRRIVICMVRIELGLCGSPNCVLLGIKILFHEEKATWLSTFVASIWAERMYLLVSWNERCICAFRVNWFGPVIESLRALPHCPDGTEYAAEFK
jgi:hypothetical protein